MFISGKSSKDHSGRINYAMLDLMSQHSQTSLKIPALKIDLIDDLICLWWCAVLVVVVVMVVLGWSTKAYWKVCLLKFDTNWEKMCQTCPAVCFRFVSPQPSTQPTKQPSTQASSSPLTSRWSTSNHIRKECSVTMFTCSFCVSPAICLAHLSKAVKTNVTTTEWSSPR